MAAPPRGKRQNGAGDGVADAQAALVVQASAVEVEEPEEAPSVAELVQRARSLMSGGAKNG